METYELDVCGTDREVLDFLVQARQANLAAQLITMDGPGGGTPVVRLTGERAVVRKFIKEVYAADCGYDDEDVDVFQVNV